MNNLLSMFLQVPAEQKWLFQSEKIYTVLTVVLLIWAGILGYLVFSLRRLGKLERELEKLSSKPGFPVQDRGKGEHI